MATYPYTRISYIWRHLTTTIPLFRNKLLQQTTNWQALQQTTNWQKKSKKHNVGRFRKGEGLKRKSSFTPLPAKRLPSKPTSELFKQVKFPHPTKFISIKLRKDETHSFCDLLILHGSQIIDMDLLSMVFSLLRYTEPKCTGSLKLYQYAFRDGLQSYLLLKCSYRHLVITEFPTSLPIGI